jgi:RecQ-mediated genome instability protein 1
MDTTQLAGSIASHLLPPPSQSLLTSLTTRSPLPPLASLVATAKARLLAADLTSSTLLDRTQLVPLPLGVENASLKEQRLQRDTHVQVVDLENLSLSRWEQIEEMEAVDRGERSRGRQVVRVTDEEAGDGAAQVSAGKNATHRLVLQDCNGARVYAVELQRIDGIGVAKTSIGCKMLLRAGTTVARGTVLLTAANCTLLGGRIDAWHDAWTAGRMARLKEAVGAGNGQTVPR